MKQDEIKVIFFDLDDTLFDYSTSSLYAKEEVFRYLLKRHPNLKYEDVIRCYDTIVSEAVKEEERGSYNTWDRQTRFSKLLALLGFDNKKGLSGKLARIYTEAREKTTMPFPGTHEALKNLKSKYPLGIITNGPSKYQRHAIRKLRLQQYLQYILISEEVGYQKPDLEIFKLALREAGCKAEEAVMVGDSFPHDIRPAKLIGMKTVLLDSKLKYNNDIEARMHSDHMIHDISELIEIY